MFDARYINMQAEVVGECFQGSAKLGLDSDDFAEKFMTSDYGVFIMKDGRLTEYCDSNFMLEGFTRELKFKKGKSYSSDVLWFAGYLYKYWVSTRGVDPREVYKLAPIWLIDEAYYDFLMEDEDYAIDILSNNCRGKVYGLDRRGSNK